MSKFKVVPTPDHGTRLVPMDEHDRGEFDDTPTPPPNNPTPPGSHTPGPWIAGNSRGGRIYNRWGIYRSGARKVAVVCENNSPEIEHANARLSAAAPELLDAARDLVSMFERGYVRGQTESTGKAFIDGVDKTRTAIAKATGH